MNINILFTDNSYAVHMGKVELILAKGEYNMFTTLIDQLLSGNECKKVYSSFEVDIYRVRDITVSVNKAPSGRIKSVNIAPVKDKS